MKLFCLYDQLSSKRTNVIEYENVSCLARDFLSYMEKYPDSLFAKRPDDYFILWLGDLSDDGILTLSPENHRNIGSLRYVLDVKEGE